jgi:hypothetical protein
MGTCTSFYEDITILKNDVKSQDKTKEEHDNKLAHTLTSDITVKSNDDIIIESSQSGTLIVNSDKAIIDNEPYQTESDETNKESIEDDFELIN